MFLFCMLLLFILAPSYGQRKRGELQGERVENGGKAVAAGMGLKIRSHPHIDWRRSGDEVICFHLRRGGSKRPRPCSLLFPRMAISPRLGILHDFLKAPSFLHLLGFSALRYKIR